MNIKNNIIEQALQTNISTFIRMFVNGLDVDVYPNEWDVCLKSKFWGFITTS